MDALPQDDPLTEADLAWHVRAWGRWVLAQARRRLAAQYPTYAEFIAPSPEWNGDRLDMRLLDLDDDGVAQLEPLNADFDTGYLKDPMKPRWVAKPTVGLPVGAHRRLQAVQGRATTAEDPMAMQRGDEACGPDYGA